MNALQLSLYSTPGEAEADWQQLRDAGYTSPYQSREWVTAWHETIGKALGIEAVVAVGRLDGKAVVVLPMGLERSAGIRTLSFLGHQYGNQNTGFWDRAFYANAAREEILPFLDEMCRRAGADLLALHNVPEIWHGRRHPLLVGTVTPSPSPVFVCYLPADFVPFFEETHSKSSRKNLLRKQRRLQAPGDYRVIKARTAEDIRRGLSAFLEQRAIRAGEAGIPNVFSGPEAQEFLSRLLNADAPANGNRPLDLWLLETGGAIRATYLCIEDAGTIYSYSNSIAHDDMLQNSPGVVLTKEIIEHACSAPGLVRLDLGLGEERYKTSWTEPFPLGDVLYAVTLKGAMKARFDAAIIRAKSAVRSSGRVWPLVRRLRKWKAGLSNKTPV
ncbi:GNAT family N-acetyltransferase [Roseibium salinum]|uniref:GNAT family N-acetyltransferase n=2 Tax=Roseibium salinum TaxID=1604349 RepID=A0ABT3R1Z1_9HYPH|nr:GNAT family N-acetyltransferase [Roseibium sp. DSM 29163]MCX2723264.1 GNAT family N-acetyltransferase [Roseibium sp. DSM 29163]